MRTIHGLRYSGWTEKALWALDHHRVSYRYREHTPLIGEALLRWRTPKGVHPSVPMMVDGGEATTGSFHIAKRAEALGQGEPLFPPEAAALIERWEQTSDDALKVARAHVLAGMLRNRQAQMESLPGFVPGFLRGLMTPTARMGVRFIARKHQAAADVDAAIEKTVVPALERLRAELAGRPYLAEGFTYADIEGAAMLQFVRPLDERYLAIGPGTREVWSHAPLAARFPDLVEWRDGLYAKHRLR